MVVKNIKETKNYVYVKFCHLTRYQLLNLSLHIGQNKYKRNRFLNFAFIGIRQSIVILNLDYFFIHFNKVVLLSAYIFKYYGKFVSYSEVTNVKTGGIGFHFASKTDNLYYDGPYIGGILSNMLHLGQQLKIKIKLNQKICHNLDKIRFKLPDLALIFSTHNFYYLVNEALYLGIPSLSIIDSDLDISNTTYFVIGNTASIYFNLYVILILSILKLNVRRLNYLYYYNFKILIFVFILKLKLLQSILIKYKNKYNKKKLIRFASFFYKISKKIIIFNFLKHDSLLIIQFLLNLVKKFLILKFNGNVLIKIINKNSIIKNYYLIFYKKSIFIKYINKFLYEKINFYLYFLRKFKIYIKRKFVFYKLLNKLININNYFFFLN